jgi:hypothetical protein
MKDYKTKILLSLTVLLFSISSYSVERTGRLGVGMSNQLKNGLPALSVKIQKSKGTAFGALLGFDTDTKSGGWGAGIKLFRNIFDEPQLNFYGALMAGLMSQKEGVASSKTGFQIDATLGSEFSFSGLSSIGFSFEFGFSFNKVDDFKVQTVGDSFIVAAAHFYL